MSLIEVKNVEKEFKIYKRKKGFLENVKALFHRTYEIKKAVNDINFTINQGEVVGYIGANGAGKSTTIKMLSGILVPTSGKIMVDGIIPYENRKENALKIGVVFGQRTQLNWDLPMEDTFELYKRMYKINDNTYRDNVDMFVELMEMQDFIRKPVRQLSLGQKMRAEIAIALLHNPKLLYLDEPTIGLDVLVKDRIRKFVKDLNAERNTTIILTTHDMTDIEQICDRIIFIDKGKILSDTSIKEFKDMHTDSYEIWLEYDEIYNSMEIPHVECIMEKDNTRLYRVKKSELPINTILEAFTKMFKIKDIHIKKKEIEEMVRDIYTNYSH